MKELEEIARDLAKGDKKLGERFKRVLETVNDREFLRDLAERYTPHVEVSMPIYERLLELAPDDVELIAALGFIFFLQGDDARAWQQVERGKKIDSRHVQLLTLEAALTNDPDAKVELYRRILEEDKDNKVAKDNLRELEKH